MAEARPLLVETDLSVEEVGRGVSYGDSGYFARAFRRAHGTTPNERKEAFQLAKVPDPTQYRE